MSAKTINISLKVPVNLLLIVSNPDEEGSGWQVDGVEFGPYQGLNASDVYSACDEADFAEIDRLANAEGPSCRAPGE